MLNPERILTTLDRHLDHEVSLVVYGRAAIALGFEESPGEIAETVDVDAILRTSEAHLVDEDMQFWDAKDATNLELEKEGLYLTHLFMETQVFLRRDWERHIVPIARPTTRWLRLFRPATLDLVLTKMMRGADEQDLRDAAFLIRLDRLTTGELEEAFAQARLPDIPELHDAFERAKPAVLALAAGAAG